MDFFSALFAGICGSVLAVMVAATPLFAGDTATILADLAKDKRGKIQPIEDEHGAMNAFYAALSRTAAKNPGAITRVAHFGDSTIEMDLTPGPIRRLLAEKFGDGGRGFVLMARPKPWYRPYDLKFNPSSSWITYDILETKTRDRRFGLGGVRSVAYRENAVTKISSVKRGPVGTGMSRIEILYPIRPGGGRMLVKVDGKDKGVIDADGTEAEAYVEIRVPDGRHKLEIVATKKNTVAYGVIMERDGPGIVYDALGVNGTGVPTYLYGADEENWTEHLRHRNPDLIILALGANDTSPDMNLAAYKKQVARLIRRARKAVPTASVLWQAPLDRATKIGGSLVSNPMSPRIVAAQREAAAKEKVAFWSAFDAMGGVGSMARWYKAKPRLGAGDLFHPTAKGGEVIAKMLYDAMMIDFDSYLRKNGVAETARKPPVSKLVKMPLQ